MKVKPVLRVFFLAAATVAAFCSCAKYGAAPGGGPVDLAPPVLWKAFPPQGSTEFEGGKIELTFDEYIVLGGIDKILVSPPLKKVSYSARLKTLTVTVEDTLAPDQTYSVNFKDAVGDLHENTPLRNFTYVFSSGKTIDSARLSGVLFDAYTLQPVKDASIFFYSRQPVNYPPDTMPLYVAVSDTGGFFEAEYMKEGCYWIMAVNKPAGDYTIHPTEEKIAFSDTCWQTGNFMPAVGFQKGRKIKESDTARRRGYDRAVRERRTDSYDEARLGEHILYMYQDWEKEKYIKEGKFNTRGEVELLWHYPPCADSLRYEFLASFSDVNMVRMFYENKAKTDSGIQTEKKKKGAAVSVKEEDLPDISWPEHLRMSVLPLQEEKGGWRNKIYFDRHAVESLVLVVHNASMCDTLELALPTSAAKKKDTAKFIVSMPVSSLKPDDSAVLNFSFPSDKMCLDSACMYQLTANDTGGTDTLLIRLNRVETRQAAMFRQAFFYGWEPSARYVLFFPQGCFTDWFGRDADTSVFTFSVVEPKDDNTGELAVELQGLKDNIPYVLQLTDAAGNVKSEQRVNGDGIYEFLKVKPGGCRFVLFEDANGNGRWDAGHYPFRLQPERRYIYHKTLNAEADWRIEEVWKIF